MSELWVRKMRTFFERMDFDKDGVITYKDFEGISQRFIEQGHLEEREAETVSAVADQLWEIYKTSADNVEEITLEVFLKAMEPVSEDSIKNIFKAPLNIIFTIIDVNSDGLIQRSEYADFFRILGLDPSLSSEPFEVLDKNEDGLLSLEEFVTAGVEFFTSREDTKTKLFYGPLVD